MRLPTVSASTRFFVSLAVLLAAVAGLAFVGLRGLANVDHVNRQVFRDNFPTAEATSVLAGDLGRAQVTSLQIVNAGDLPTADRLRAELNQTIVPTVDRDIKALVRLHAGDEPAEAREVGRVPAEWQRFVALTQTGTLSVSGGMPDRTRRAAEANAVDSALGPLTDFTSRLRPREIADASVANRAAQGAYGRSRTWIVVAALLAAVALASMIHAGLMLRRLLLDQSEEQVHNHSGAEYTDTLQATENEDEAHELLRRQVERTQEGTRAVVLARNNSEDRLEPRTSLDEIESLREPLEHATPRSCLAVRFGLSHVEGVDAKPLARCSVCGDLPGISTCEPLLVGGEVIGSVLVNHEDAPDRRAAGRLRDTVRQSAPVLANLRNLAVAELRAATDRLTGLPNQRAVQETLKRLVAQASRTITPLSAVLVDLDHFKQINDVYGHDSGDDVLASVGAALRSVLRESDFAGRYGGEEFLVLLPATDTEGAVQVAEGIRTAIATIRVPRVERPITASAGVAVLPKDAGDAVTLFRAADRALYAAKKGGRNQVQAAVNEPALLDHRESDDDRHPQRV